MTNNNQYFERNMLINAEKTNKILESNDWEPTKEDQAIVWKRIEERIQQKPEWYRHYGVSIV